MQKLCKSKYFLIFAGILCGLINGVLGAGGGIIAVWTLRMALGDELYAIHYNDNHGASDEHIAPFLGTLNNDEVVSALVDVGFKGYFTLEACSSLVKYNQWTGKRRRFRDGEALKLREPQLFMQRHIEAMTYDIAEWMLRTYGVFES